jgi:hypothetical protein
MHSAGIGIQSRRKVYRHDGDAGGIHGRNRIEERNAQVVRYDSDLYSAASFKLLARDVVNPAFPVRHDTQKLAGALVEILNAK